jgi:hypothetical protein
MSDHLSAKPHPMRRWLHLLILLVSPAGFVAQSYFASGRTPEYGPWSEWLTIEHTQMLAIGIAALGALGILCAYSSVRLQDGQKISWPLFASVLISSAGVVGLFATVLLGSL